MLIAIDDVSGKELLSQLKEQGVEAKAITVFRDEKLLDALRLMRAWFTPGGPTPKEKMPVKRNVLLAAELELERLYDLPANAANNGAAGIR